MARNEEKQLGRLNRLYLAKQKQEELVRKPKRPKLDILKTSEDIKKWLPSIKCDLEFYLAQIQVGCYPERKIEEFNHKIDCLKREYNAYIRKLKQIDPSCDTIPWTDRGYGKRKTNDADGEVCSESDAKLQRNQNDKEQQNQNDNAMPERLNLPVLESETEMQYKLEKCQNIGSKTESLNIVDSLGHKDIQLTDDQSNTDFQDCNSESIVFYHEGNLTNKLQKCQRKSTDLYDTSDKTKNAVISSGLTYTDTGSGCYNNLPLQFKFSGSNTMKDCCKTDESEFYTTENQHFHNKCSADQGRLLTSNEIGCTIPHEFHGYIKNNSKMSKPKKSNTALLSKDNSSMSNPNSNTELQSKVDIGNKLLTSIVDYSSSEEST